MVTISNSNRHNGFADREFKGLSTDTKPTFEVGTNSLFLELDTGDFYYFTGETWEKVGASGS